MALECCDRFSTEHPEYKFRCIFNRGSDLFQDLRVYFLELGNHLVLVDDANRIGRFDYFIQLLQDQQDTRRIKIVATVRDYALDKIRVAAQPFGGGAEVEIQPLEDKQIDLLVRNEYSIRNQHFLDRIVHIAKGNPRLAIMAAEVAVRENTLQSIVNVSALYDEYFASIRKDLEDLDDQNLLRVAGIVTFSRTVDRSNLEIATAIEDAFGVPAEAFWKGARQLHNLEILDMYENEVIKISDQVLATYIFYLAFFKERVLDFAVLLERFFPHFRGRLVDALNPVLDAFDSKMIMDAMRPHVDKIWKSMEKDGNDEGPLHLMEVFWFLKQTDTLVYLHDRIQELEPKPVNFSEMKLEANSNVPSPSILSIISMFQYADDTTFRMALDLLYAYLAKLPADLPYVIYILTDRFSFKPSSYLQGYFIQKAVIDTLRSRIGDEDEQLFPQLFLLIAKKYLRTHFDTSHAKGLHTIEIIKFDLQPATELSQLRHLIWDQIFQLYQHQDLRKAVLDVLHWYCNEGLLVSLSDIIKEDAVLVLAFMESKLEPGNTQHCTIVQDYLDFLGRHNLPFNQELRDRFRNEAYALAELFLFNLDEFRDLNLDYGAYQQYKLKKIRDHFTHYTFADYERFLDLCIEIQVDLDTDHKKFLSRIGVITVFNQLAERDPSLYTKVIDHYLGLADPFGLDTILLTQKLIEICGPDRAFEVLNKSTYPTKQSWLFGYYQSGLSETNPPLSLLCLKFNGLCREPCRTYPIRPQFIPQGCKIIAKFIIFRLTCRTYHVWYLHAASI